MALSQVSQVSCILLQQKLCKIMCRAFQVPVGVCACVCMCVDLPCCCYNPEPRNRYMNLILVCFGFWLRFLLAASTDGMLRPTTLQSLLLLFSFSLSSLLCFLHLFMQLLCLHAKFSITLQLTKAKLIINAKNMLANRRGRDSERERGSEREDTATKTAEECST